MELSGITEEAIMAKNPVQFQKGLGMHEFLFVKNMYRVTLPSMSIGLTTAMICQR
jgi:hypothetical protein